MEEQQQQLSKEECSEALAEHGKAVETPTHGGAEAPTEQGGTAATTEH